MRYDSPFQALSRRAKSSLAINGEQIAAGDTVWFWIAAGNHDPTRFSEPETLNLERIDNRHLSFGMGPHYCLGAALARLELHVALSTLRAVPFVTAYHRWSRLEAGWSHPRTRVSVAADVLI